MGTLLIQNINQNEKEEIIKVAKSMLEEIEGSNNNQLFEQMRSEINKKIVDFKSIKYDKELAGYFHLGLRDDSSIEIYFLFIFEEYRKKGIGSQVIEHAIYQAYAKKKKLVIEVSEKNKYVIRWLNEFQFKQVGKNNGNVIFEIHPESEIRDKN